MTKTEPRTVTRNGITFLGLHYRNELLFNLREQVYIRYSLFDLSKVYVYSLKGEFLCIAKQETKVHPMAYHLGTVKDTEEFKQKIQKQRRQLNKAKKEFLKYFPTEKAEVLEISDINEEPIIELIPVIEKPKRERKKSGLRAEAEEACVEQDSKRRLMRATKQTPQELQMNKPFFNNDYEKYEWLMANGCTNPVDRSWLTKYIRSDEYINMYGD